MNKNTKDIITLISENDIEHISFKFLNPQGNLNQLDVTSNFFKMKNSENNKNIKMGNIELIPSYDLVFLDPFRSTNTLSILAENINEKFNSRKILREILAKSSIATQIEISIELEFCIFDDVRFSTDAHNVTAILDSDEASYNNFKEFRAGNNAYRPIPELSSFAVDPIDSLVNIRAEIAKHLEQIGIKTEYHTHGKYPGQCIIRCSKVKIVDLANNFPIIKYIIRNVVASYGKSVTFMPTPMKNTYNNLIVEIFFLKWHDKIRQYEHRLQNNINSLSAFTNPSVNGFRKLLHMNKDKLFTISNNSISINYVDSTIDFDLTISALILAFEDKENSAIPQVEKNMLPKDFLSALKILKMKPKYLEPIVLLNLDYYINLKTLEYKYLQNHVHPLELQLYYNL